MRLKRGPEHEETRLKMSTVDENWNLIFYAEGEDAVEYIDLMDDEDEEFVVEEILDGKLEEIDETDMAEPEPGDEIYEHPDGYVLVYSRSNERLWLYELTDPDED